jgi:peptidoglycan-N-acetylglucosamine deacetylase
MQDKASGLLLVGLIGLAAFVLLISEPAIDPSVRLAPPPAIPAMAAEFPKEPVQVTESKQKALEEAAVQATTPTNSYSALPMLDKPTSIASLVSLPTPLPPTIPQSVPAQPIDPGIEKNEWPVQIVNSGSPNSKQIALTFDDGPHPKYTLKVLDDLRERKIKATFFVLGNRVKQYPWVVRQTIAEGHEIGNHTFDHRFLTAMSNDLIEKEILDTQREIKTATGYETRLFRPPYGAFRQSARQIFHNLNLIIVLWSVDPQDWKIRNSEKINNFVSKKTQNGSIILCHDIHPSTISALPTLLDHLLDEGYEFVTVSQLCQLPPMQIVVSNSDQALKDKNTQPVSLTSK